MANFSKSSKEKRATLHPELQRVLDWVIQFVDFKIDCGLRGKKEQNEAYDRGNSHIKYPDGLHNRSKVGELDDGTPVWDETKSDAVDILPYPVEFPNAKKQSKRKFAKCWGRFYYLAGFIMGVASVMGVKLGWGGHWKKFMDAPHFERKR